MYMMEKAARRAGFAVLRPAYPSLRMDADKLVHRWINPALEAARNLDGGPVNVVTHSLGGILLRMAIGRNAPSWFGRAVMICPPNGGSEIVDFLRRRRLGRLIGPTGMALGTGPDSLPGKLPPVPFECGVIAADLCIDPILGALLPRPCDGKVSVASTRCEGVREYALVHVNHALSMCHPDSIRLTIRFLQTGSFRE
jgi:hypothetical protein